MGEKRVRVTGTPDLAVPYPLLVLHQRQLALNHNIVPEHALENGMTSAELVSVLTDSPFQMMTKAMADEILRMLVAVYECQELERRRQQCPNCGETRDMHLEVPSRPYGSSQDAMFSPVLVCRQNVWRPDL